MEWSYFVTNISNFNIFKIKQEKNQTFCLNSILMAPFDLHEVIGGHITPGICGGTGTSVTIVQIGAES